MALREAAGAEKRPRRRVAASRPRPQPPTGPGHVWAYDFVFDACADGRQLKCLTVVDEWTRECLAIDVAGSIRSSRVIEVLARLASVHGAPRVLRSDNGPEFVSTAVLRWLADERIDTAHIDPGKPWQNGTDESFNGRFREECLDLEWFRTREEARVLIEAWRLHYNAVRPHSSLDYLTPNEFKRSTDIQEHQPRQLCSSRWSSVSGQVSPSFDRRADRAILPVAALCSWPRGAPRDRECGRHEMIAMSGKGVTRSRRQRSRTLERPRARYLHWSWVMTTTIRVTAALTLLTGLTIAGCAHDAPTANSPSPSEGTAIPEGVTNAQNTADLRVVDRFANACCERAQACNDVGDGKTYSSPDLCMQQVRGNIANDLTGYKCPHGLDNRAVEACTAAIEDEPCGHSHEGLSHMSQCRTDALCLR